VTGPRFFAEALAEYEDAVVYYEKREEGLGARLIQEFDEAVALALEYPGTFPAMQEAPAIYGLRWVMLRSFPIKSATRKGLTCWGADLPISLTALPSGCHEAAVRAGTAWDQTGGGGMRFSRNLRLVRGKVASRKELSHQR
jgi:hypothetical protein